MFTRSISKFFGSGGLRWKKIICILYNNNDSDTFWGSCLYKKSGGAAPEFLERFSDLFFQFLLKNMV